MRGMIMKSYRNYFVFFFIALILSVGIYTILGKQEPVHQNSGVSASAIGAPAGTEAPTRTEYVLFVDDLGREMELPLPIKRAAVANRYNNELVRAIGAGDKVVAADLYTSQDDVYWPQFDPKNTFGRDEYNYEMLASMDIQVLIMPKNGPVEESAEKLAPFGIKVAVVTGWDNSDVPKQVRLLGQLFGCEAGAEELVSYYEKPVAYMKEQLKQVDGFKTVYWEYGGDYTTCIPGTSNDGWHNMILMAGGKNIFGDPGLAGQAINPEAILLANPDLIVKIYSGAVVGNSGIFTAPPVAEFKAKAEEMLARPGWGELNAVREENFYLNTAFMSGGMGKMIGAAYIAKWLYPDIMTELDPDAIFNQWLNYQGFDGPNAPHVYHVVR